VADNFRNNRVTVQQSKKNFCTFIDYKQDSCMEQRDQDYEERASRQELTDRELYGISLRLSENDFANYITSSAAAVPTFVTIFAMLCTWVQFACA
jgi:hypothetical protein